MVGGVSEGYLSSSGRAVGIHQTKRLGTTGLQDVEVMVCVFG